MRTSRLKSIVVLLAGCGMAIGAPFADVLAYPTPLSDPHATPIVCMKRLPDGASVCVHNKTVVAVSNGNLYIEEADRSAGIKVDAASYYPPPLVAPGDLITVTGEMGTADGLRVIYARSEFVCDYDADANIGTLGVSSPVLMGWPVDEREPEGERVSGLIPYGLLVRVWGLITARELMDDDGSWYLYLDDGWNKKYAPEFDYTGIRVYSDKIPPAEEDYQVAIGVCTTKTYDPNPSEPGDEFTIPVVRTTSYDDLYYPSYPSQPRTFGSASGRVRLVGHTGPGLEVRVYTQSESLLLQDVTDSWTPFTLQRVWEDGLKVSASVAGYVSETIDVAMGATDADIELSASSEYVEIASDKASIKSCSQETAAITVLVRDCEGKALGGRQVKLTTTMGSFVANNQPEIILTADPTGFASTLFTAAPDGAGVAVIRAENYPEPADFAQTQVIITGPEISVAASVAYLTQPGESLITGHLSDGGAPIADASVTFRTDHGVFLESGTQSHTTMTDQYGDARATLQITTPGCARVTAAHIDACSHAAIGWTAVAYKVAAWYASGVLYSHPAVIDLDGAPNGKKEVVVLTSAGNLVALDSQAQLLWSKTMHPQGSNTVGCAPMDGERSGLPCVFLGAENQQKLYAYAHDGSPLAGWPVGSNYRFIRVAPAIADLNRDGSPEIVAGDECCYVFSWNPTGDWKATGTAESSYLWRNLTGTPSTAIYGSTCAVGDIGSPSGILDVVVGTNHAPEVYCFQADLWGDYVSNPRYVPFWPRGTEGRVATSPAVGDIDGDGKDDVAAGSDSAKLFIWLSSDDSWTGYDLGGPVRSSPALADLDGNGKLDVVVGSDSGCVYAVNWLGQAVPGWAGGIRLNSSGNYAVESSPVIGDVTGDGIPEVVVGCNDGNVYALYADGTEHQESGALVGPIAWIRCCLPPAETSAAVMTAPAIDDLDNDGYVDVVVCADKGVFVFQFSTVPHVSDPARYPWPTFHHDNARTGYAGVLPPPANASIQGIVTLNGQPISGAEVYVYFNDGSTVYQPYSDPPAPRGFVYTVGSLEPTAVGKGAYCISQLEPNRTYKLKIVVAGEPDHWEENIAVTTGLVRVDVAL